MTPPNLDTLIRDLSNLHKDLQIEELFGKTAVAPQPVVRPFQEVEQALEAVRELGLSRGDDLGNLHLLRTVGSVYERFLHVEKAHQTFAEALALAEQLKDTRAQAATLRRLGRVLSLRNSWGEALQYLDRSLETYTELGDAEGQARALVDQGIVFHEQGDYQAAQKAYEEAVALAQQGDKKDIVAYASNNLAVLATIRGDFDEAITQYQRCLVIYQEIGEQREAARSYHNLGMTHADRRDWNAAMDCYSRSFEIAQEHQQLDVMANVYLSQAELLLDLGDSSMVAAFCVRALEIYRKIGNHLGEADGYRLLGRVFTLRQQWNTGTALFQDSLRLNEEYNNPLGTAEAHRDLGKMQTARGRHTDARASFEAALEGFRKLGARADVVEVERLIAALQN